jgi:hypothetical protein
VTGLLPVTDLLPVTIATLPTVQIPGRSREYHHALRFLAREMGSRGDGGDEEMERHKWSLALGNGGDWGILMKNCIVQTFIEDPRPGGGKPHGLAVGLRC